jgi:hypothetical protein
MPHQQQRRDNNITTAESYGDTAIRTAQPRRRSAIVLQDTKYGGEVMAVLPQQQQQQQPGPVGGGGAAKSRRRASLQDNSQLVASFRSSTFNNRTETLQRSRSYDVDDFVPHPPREPLVTIHARQNSSNSRRMSAVTTTTERNGHRPTPPLSDVGRRPTTTMRRSKSQADVFDVNMFDDWEDDQHDHVDDISFSDLAIRKR